jgi:hypothetical protein
VNILKGWFSMKRFNLLFALGALGFLLAAGCATGQAARDTSRTGACASTTVRNVSPREARGERALTAAPAIVRNPRPQAARGGRGDHRGDNGVVADPLRAAGRGSQSPGCPTGLAHAGEAAPVF